MLLSALTAFLSVIPFFVSAQDRSLAQVKTAFDNAGIPANLNIKFNPTVLLEVTFPQAAGPAIMLHAGEQLPRNATAGPPSFAISTVGPTPRANRFVIATVDPDAPTPQNPTSAQIRHFLGGDFTFRAGGQLRNNTPAISNFLQPTPPAGSDPHRYVFLLFEQPAGFDAQTVVTPTTSVSGFNISLFAQEVGLGNPIGGTFMRVGPDPTA